MEAYNSINQCHLVQRAPDLLDRGGIGREMLILALIKQRYEPKCRLVTQTVSAAFRLHFGVSTARRGWVAPQQVINCWETERLLEWLRKE